MIIIRVSIVIINIIIDLHTQCTSSAPMPWHPYHFSRHVPMCDAWHDTCDTWKYLAHIFYFLSLIFSLHVTPWNGTHIKILDILHRPTTPQGPTDKLCCKKRVLRIFGHKNVANFFQQNYLLMKGTKRVIVLLNPHQMQNPSWTATEATLNWWAWKEVSFARIRFHDQAPQVSTAPTVPRQNWTTNNPRKQSDLLR